MCQRKKDTSPRLMTSFNKNAGAFEFFTFKTFPDGEQNPESRHEHLIVSLPKRTAATAPPSC